MTRLEERDKIRTALKAADFAVSGLTEGPNPTTGYVADVDGERSDIAVAELFHKEARRQSKPGNLHYFQWDQPSFLTHIQAIIDKAAKRSGGSHARKVLVIWTKEFVLGRDTVARFLDGQRFVTTAFTDVVLGLDYHPDYQDVAFRLVLSGAPPARAV